MKIPDYDIKREIGKGGMSTVYLAIQESLDRQVALKVMTPALVVDPNFRKRFLKEGKIIAKLHHPNIISVYHIGIYENYYYIVLEYAESGSLTQYIRRGLSVDEAVYILKQIASALGYAHDQGIVHRDVKPGNILFRVDKTPLLSDFGIAKTLDPSGTQLTMAGATIGSPNYMSPEQILTKSVSARSDLYSLGAVFYEMLTGKSPYEAENSFAAALMHLSAPVPGLPKQLAKFQPIIDHLLAKDPIDRFSDAKQLILATEKIQAGGSFARPLEELNPRAESKSGESSRQSRSLGPFPAPFQDQSDEVAPTAAQDQSSKGLAVVEIPADSTKTRLSAATVPSGDAVAAARPGPSPAFSKWAFGVLVLLSLAVGSFLYWYYQVGLEKTEIDASLPLSVRSPADFVGLRMQRLREVAATYQSILRMDPENSAATQGLQTMVDKYEQLARQAWAQADRESSLAILDQGLRLMPRHPGLMALKNEIENAQSHPAIDTASKQQIALWLREAEDHLAASRFIFPAGKNAVDTYKMVLQLDPSNELALRRLNELATFFEQMARTDLEDGRMRQAISKIEQGLMINPQHAGLLELRKKIESQPSASTSR